MEWPIVLAWWLQKTNLKLFYKLRPVDIREKELLRKLANPDKRTESYEMALALLSEVDGGLWPSSFLLELQNLSLAGQLLCSLSSWPRLEFEADHDGLFG